MSDAVYTYPGLNAYTLVPDNSSYLSNTGHIPVVSSMGNPTLGLMMLLSTFQYQSPYMNPTYSYAASQMGKAAFIYSGGQELQDKESGALTKNGIDFAHSLGLTDTEMGIVGLTYKTIKRREIDINGPKVYNVKTDLTGTQNSGSIGLKYEW